MVICKRKKNMHSTGKALKDLLYPPQEPPFRRTWPGWVVAALNAIMGLLSANFFLGMLKVSFPEWLLMNTCVPSLALFILGFLLGCPTVMLAGSVVMFYYGTLGMLTFSWSGGNLFAQAGHISMTLAVIYTVREAVRQKRWKSWAAGVTLGFLFWIPFNINQFFFFVDNPKLAKDLFSGNMVPPGY
jgi:hypothetical protein